MNLLDLPTHHPHTARTSVPDWMIGCFRRRCISFANGTSDQRTRVFWLQSRNLTIDLRLPAADDSDAHGNSDSHPLMADHEGWIANSVWDGRQLHWRQATSLQLHNRWPEPALLQRIGNCMIEFAPSGVYVEDWRLQPTPPGPLIGLRLMEERDDNGTLIRAGGGLIVCGHHAALVLDRPVAAAQAAVSGGDLHTLIREGAPAAELLDFETSVAAWDGSSGFVVRHSTRPERVGSPLCPLDGFSEPGSDGRLRQRLTIDGQVDGQADGRTIERCWAIDTLEPEHVFPQTTDTTDEAQDWFERESRTLCRYTEQVY